VTTACVAGLLAGLLHVFAGPDHLAALAPLSLRAGRRAWTVGFRWGLGHSSGVLVVAALAFGLRQVVHLEAISGWGERLVGATMIVLGLWGVRSLFRERLHAHEHVHDGHGHVHFHVHRPGEDHRDAKAHVHTHAAFWVGTLHGLAGTAHLVGVLPSLALPTGGETAGYLIAFGIGTVVAMTAFAGAIGLAAPGRSERGLRVYRWALGSASALCTLTGIAWIVLPLYGVPLP
jgi:sulfite exporter TauE/SafE